MKAKYKVNKANILGHWNGEWVVEYYCGSYRNFDVRGTNGCGCKFFSTKEKAIASGERYLKKMKEYGYEIEEK